MDPQPSVLVDVGLEGATVTLAVTGCLTQVDQQCLMSLVVRTRTAFPRAGVTVDFPRIRPVHHGHFRPGPAIPGRHETPSVHDQGKNYGVHGA